MFIDVESSIEVYCIKIWRGFFNNFSIIVFFSFDGNVIKVILDLLEEFGNGKIYYINVIVVNNVGLEFILKLDGFVVDIIFLVCFKVWDGKSYYFNDMEYVLSLNEFIILWDCYDSEFLVVQFWFVIKDL